MKIKLLVAAAATVVASSAMAQSAFQGFYGQIATGYENNSAKSSTTTITTDTGDFGTYNNPSNNFGTAPLVVGLGYTFLVDPKFTLGLGADYSILTAKSGNVTSTSSSDGFDPNTGYYKVSNRYNIYLAPGYVIDKDKLAYLKVGYSSQAVQSFSSDDGSSSPKQNMSGYILGLGYKQIITGGLYGFGEANYMSYSNKTVTSTGSCSEGCSSYTNSTTMGGSAYTLLVGLGYKF
jgi:hypothetical protein